MSSELLGSAHNVLKGNLGGAWDINKGYADAYTDLGIARRFGGSAAAYSLRDIGAMNGRVVKVRRDVDGQGTDPEEDFSANQVASGALEDWVNGKLEGTLPADVATAEAAFSLRKVKAGYSGNAVRIRRSSDDAEVNVAFDSDDKVSTSSSISVLSGSTSATTLNEFLNETLTVGTAVNGTGSFPYDQFTANGNTGFDADNKGGGTSSAGFAYSFADGDVIVIRFTVSNFDSESGLSPSFRGTTSTSSVTGVTTGGFTFTANGTYTETHTATADGSFFMCADGNTGSYTISDFEIVSHTHQAFVHTWYDQTIDLTEVSTYYDTPFAVSNPFTVSNATEEYGTYLGRDNVVKITTTAGNGQKYHQEDFGIGAGESVRVTAEIYIPSSNTTIDSFAWNEKFNFAGNDRKQGLITPTQDQWVDIDFNYVQVDDTSQRISFWDSSTASPTANNDVTGDVIYFRNLIVTRVTKANQDATQETSANQPKIAESGSLLADGIDFDGSASYLDGTASLGATTTFGAFIVHKPDDTDENQYLIDNRDGTGDGMRIMQRSDADGNYRFSMDSTDVNSASGSVTTNETLLTAIQSSTAATLFKNAVQQATAADDAIDVTLEFRIGANRVSTGTYFDGTMKEIILFTSDQSDNRFKIESNINNYYGLYNDANETNATEFSFLQQRTGGVTVSNGVSGFTLDVETASSFAGFQLKEKVANTDVIYLSFNAVLTGGSGGDASPKVALRQTSISSTVRSNEVNVTAGFNSVELTSNNNDAEYLAFSEGDDNRIFTISNLKVSRIARNGFVETWYDQSASGNDISNATASEQPDIVMNGGLVKTENGQPCLNFQNNVLFTSGASPLDGVANAYFSVFSMKASATGGEVFRNGSTRNANITYASGNTSLYHYYADGSSTPFVQKTGQGGTNLRIDQFILTGDRDSDSLGAAIDDGSLTTANMTGISTDAITGNLFIGARTSNPASNDFEGKFAEFIGFNADKSSERESIRDELNLHYNTF